MAKNPMPMAYDIASAQPKSRRWRIGTIVILAIFALPLAMEGAVLCYGQWSSITGTKTHVSTPVLDMVTNAVSDTRSILEDHLSPTFARVFKEPQVAIPVALVLIVCGMLFLRR